MPGGGKRRLSRRRKKNGKGDAAGQSHGGLRRPMRGGCRQGDFKRGGGSRGAMENGWWGGKDGIPRNGGGAGARSGRGLPVWIRLPAPILNPNPPATPYSPLPAFGGALPFSGPGRKVCVSLPISMWEAEAFSVFLPNRAGGRLRHSPPPPSYLGPRLGPCWAMAAAVATTAVASSGLATRAKKKKRGE